MYNEQIEFHTFINSVTEEAEIMETEVNGGCSKTIIRIMLCYEMNKLNSIH